MVLEERTAIVYGAGSIGGAVARAFAREGARVFLAGRNRDRLDAAAEAIRAAGGTAKTAVVDALDAAAVDAHADAVAVQAGGIDVSFNLITHGDVQGTPMAEMDVDDYVERRRRCARVDPGGLRGPRRHRPLDRGPHVARPRRDARRRGRRGRVRRLGPRA
jgi:NAD(P)-dependent dehydrogenase (short-subunit alcohol dehydrogenase family)